MIQNLKHETIKDTLSELLYNVNNKLKEENYALFIITDLVVNTYKTSRGRLYLISHKGARSNDKLCKNGQKINYAKMVN